MKDSTDASVRNSTMPSGSSPKEKDLFGEKLRFLGYNDFIAFPEEAPARDVLRGMRETRFGGVLITDKPDSNTLVGIFTERDYLDKMAGAKAGANATLEGDPIKKYMTPSPKVLSPDDTVGDAIRFMTKGGYRHIPLIDDKNCITGLISVRNIVDFISEHFPEEVYNHPPKLHQRISTQEGG